MIFDQMIGDELIGHLDFTHQFVVKVRSLYIFISHFTGLPLSGLHISRVSTKPSQQNSRISPGFPGVF